MTDGVFGRRNATLPASMWNVYQWSLVGASRTNNAEAALQSQFNEHHPRLLKFIEGIKAVQHSKDSELERYAAGFVHPKKRNRYFENDLRIIRIVEKVDRSPLVDTLRGIAHTYQMNV